MKLSLMLVYEQLDLTESILKTQINPGPSFEGVRVLPKEPKELNPEYLYVDIQDISANYKDDVWSRVTLVSLENHVTEAAFNAIVIKNNCNIFDVFNQIIEIFHRFQDWENAVKGALLKKQAIEEILNLCKMVTPETVYITNLSLKMIAHSTPTIMGDVSAIWNYQATYGYMPMNVVKSLIDSGELDKINSNRLAFTLPTKSFNLPYTCRNIFCDNVMRAHIFIVSIYSKPLQSNKEIADVLGELFTVYVRENVEFFSLTGLLHEHFFRDILLGRLTDHVLIRQQLSAFGWRVNDGYLLFVMEKENEKLEPFRMIAHYLERFGFDCKGIELDNDLVIVFHVERDQKKRQRIQDTLEGQLEKHNCKGTLGKWFANFTDMSVYYQQAKVIISFCRNMPNSKKLLVEEEFGLYGFIEAGLKNNNVFQVCHPDIITLYEFDKENGTECVETLFQYLICDRNVVKASKALYIHRNTMKYRLERMKTVVDFEAENSDVKIYLIMSIYILKYVLKMQLADPNDYY